MTERPGKPFLPPKPIRPYIPLERRKAMTIALGLPCTDGLVICTDGQLTVSGGHKFQEEKIECEEFYGATLVFSYAGLPGLWKEARNKIVHSLQKLEAPFEEGPAITPENVYNAADEVFTGMGRLYTELNLQMLIAVGGVLHAPELFVFDRNAFYRATDFTCLGVGESSLVRYLADSLYRRSISKEEGKNIGIYLVSKAIQYIDGIGPPIDAIVVSGHLPEWLSEQEIKERESAMLSKEKPFLKKIVSPSSPSTTEP